MSRQLAFSIVGGVIGYFITGTPVGFQYGAAAGAVAAALTADDINSEGPRPDDSKLPGASEGDPIPYVEGTARVAGVVGWASEKRVISTTTSQGGKGPDQNVTTFSEEIDVIILLTCNEMAALRRVWAYGKLEWSQADDADAQTLVDSQTTDLWQEIRFYTGAADQLPDPDYEAVKGVGNTPAYPGRSYVYIRGLRLQGGSQLPVLNFEVCSAATRNFIAGSVWLLHGEGTPGSQTFTDSTQFGHDGEPDAGTEDEIFLSTDQEVFGSSSIFMATPPDETITYDILATDTFDHAADESWTLRFRHRFDTIPEGDLIGGDCGLSCWSQSAQLRLYLDAGTRTLTPICRTDSAIVEGEAVSIDTLAGWHLYEASYNAADGLLRIFVDGQLQNTGAYSSSFDGTDLTLYRNNQAGYFDEVHVVRGLCLHTDSYVPETTPDSPIAFYSVTAETVPLDEVVDRLCERTGLLQPADYDNSALSAIPVRGMVVNRATSTRAVLEMLQRGYLFEQVEGDTLKAVLRGGAPAETIPYDDLGTSEGEAPAEPLPIRRLNDIEQAARVTVKYLNVSNDYQTGTATGDRLITNSTAEQSLELALVFTPQEAKRLADVFTMDIAMSLTTIGPVQFGRKYKHLEPTDVVLLTNSDGSVYRARLLKITDSGDVRTGELVADDATSVNSLALTDSNYTPQTLVRGAAPTTAVYGDWPILRDGDNTPGFYVAASAVGRWGGARIMESPDDVAFAELTQVLERAVVGVTSTELGEWTGGNLFDERNSVTVNVGEGELSSATHAAILADDTLNAMAIGAHGRWEFIQFKTATLESAGVYTLRGLLRGRRGTEWATGTHTAADSVVLVQPTGLRRIEDQQADVNLPRYLRAVSIGRQLDSVASQTFTEEGVGQKPFAPVDLALHRDGSGNITATARRRTRLSHRFLTPAIELPLGETVEAYVVEIFEDDTFAAVVRTINVTAPAFSYSAADQTTDFGSPQAEIHLRMYQLSAQVGRGYALEAST